MDGSGRGGTHAEKVRVPVVIALDAGRRLHVGRLLLRERPHVFTCFCANPIRLETGSGDANTRGAAPMHAWQRLGLVLVVCSGNALGLLIPGFGPCVQTRGRRSSAVPLNAKRPQLPPGGDDALLKLRRDRKVCTHARACVLVVFPSARRDWSRATVEIVVESHAV